MVTGISSVLLLSPTACATTFRLTMSLLLPNDSGTLATCHWFVPVIFAAVYACAEAPTKKVTASTAFAGDPAVASTRSVMVGYAEGNMAPPLGQSQVTIGACGSFCAWM